MGKQRRGVGKAEKGSRGELRSQRVREGKRWHYALPGSKLEVRYKQGDVVGRRQRETREGEVGEGMK